MFDLPETPPQDFAALQQAIDWSVRRRAQVPAGRQAVRVDGASWPAGERLGIDMTDAVVEADVDPSGVPEHLKPPVLVGARTPGPTFARFEVAARPMRVHVEGGGVLHVRMDVRGTGVSFDYGQGDRGGYVMAPAGGNVDVEVGVDQQALLRVVEAKARDEAGQQGVQVEGVAARFTSPAPRVLAVTGELAGAKKIGFFNARFRVFFEAELVAEPDAEGGLTGRVARLDLRGDGAVMSTILALAKPAIEKIRRRPLPLGDLLAAAGVRGLKVKDVRVDAGQELVLRASFAGSALAA